MPPARVCSHRQRHGLRCGASRSPQRGVTGRAPPSGLARGLKINACECPAEAEAGCTIGGNASACKHCFAADTCFLRPAVGTLILQTQRGSGAAPQPLREPGRALARPRPNQGHRQRAVALGRLGDTRYRWLSPGPLPASVARHRAASLPRPRISWGSPHRAGLGAPCCEAAPAASWLSPALAALPVPCLNAAPEPREALSRAELSLGWGSCCPAPPPQPRAAPRRYATTPSASS